MKRLAYTALVLLWGLNSNAALQISLLTAGQTDEYVFFLYGHTALRVKSESEDLVYNYGYFSMQQEHFILNFMLGKPMYSLGVTPFEDFLYDYPSQGRSVTEQILNLTEEESFFLKRKLEWNAQPENRDYQYNFYFDNCATRPRDLIEQSVGGLIYNIDRQNMPTFREAIRNKSYSNQWYTVGTDLCLGWMSDQKMSIHDAAFLPDLLMQELDLATRKDNGEKVILMKIQHLPQTRLIEGSDPGGVHWPMMFFMFISLLYMILFIFGKGKLKGCLVVLRSILYFVLGAGGIVLWFLAFVSEHPHTFPNANMLLLHPFWIIVSITIWGGANRWSKLNYWLYLINFVAIVIYLTLGYVQVLPQGVPILALLVGVDALLQTLTYKKEIRMIYE